MPSRSRVRCLFRQVAGWTHLACLVPLAQGAELGGETPARPACQALAESPRALLDAAQTLLQRARTSADAADLIRAQALIQRILDKAPGDPRAWTLQAWLDMTRHRFRDALACVRRAHGLGPPSAVSLGLEADALVELGRYGEAVAVTQKLLDAFPGLPANLRAAHLRKLHGDLPGAIALLGDSLRHAFPGSEAHAWAFRQLAEYLLDAGRLDEAQQALNRAESVLSARARDATLRARLQEVSGRPAQALATLLQAQEAAPNPESALSAWKLARRLGDAETARRQEVLLDGMARLDATGERLFRRSFAEYAALQGRAGEAERLAREELTARPDIYSHALLALVLKRAGKTGEAARHAQAALKLGTRDFRILQWSSTTETPPPKRLQAWFPLTALETAPLEARP